MRVTVEGVAILVLASTLVVGAAPRAEAFVKMSGSFEATKTCPASRRIGGAADLRVEAGTRYRLFGKNREDASHYRIRVGADGASDRWVPVDCGRLVGAGGTGAPAPVTRRYVLAVSWQPAFCETRPGKPECTSMTARRPDATRFSLHGLWPQPRGREYCNVAPGLRDLDRRNGWASLPPLTLSGPTRARLETAMPGTRSFLHRHEWVKHGTCYGMPAERYFSDSLALLDALNGSELRRLFAGNIGRTLQLAEIRAAADRSFGAGAGGRLDVRCVRDGGRILIAELRISLAGTLGTPPSLGALLAAAPPVRSRCRAGVVDPAGLQ